MRAICHAHPSPFKMMHIAVADNLVDAFEMELIVVSYGRSKFALLASKLVVQPLDDIVLQFNGLDSHVLRALLSFMTETCADCRVPTEASKRQNSESERLQRNRKCYFHQHPCPDKESLDKSAPLAANLYQRCSLDARSNN